MTLYTRQFRVAAGTPRSDAVDVTIEVSEAVVTTVTVFIDPGSNGEVDVLVLDGEQQIVPDDAGDPISKPGETGPVELSPGYRLPSDRTEVTVRAFAPAARFEHEVIAQIETAPVTDADPLFSLLDRFAATDVGDAFEGLDTVDAE